MLSKIDDYLLTLCQKIVDYTGILPRKLAEFLIVASVASCAVQSVGYMEKHDYVIAAIVFFSHALWAAIVWTTTKAVMADNLFTWIRKFCIALLSVACISAVIGKAFGMSDLTMLCMLFAYYFLICNDPPPPRKRTSTKLSMET